MAGTIATEGTVDVLQPLDEIAHQVARCLATSGLTEMRATAEWARFIDLAQPVFEKWTTAIGGGGHGFSATGAPSLGGEHGFSTRKIRSFSRELETTAGRSTDAFAVQRTSREFLVDLTYLTQPGRGIWFVAPAGSA
jgi:hypothetical protein